MGLGLVTAGEVTGFWIINDRGASAPDDALFQTGSLSKLISAAVALDVLGPDPDLLAILDHSAGYNLKGLKGYDAGAALPTTGELMAGAAPANNPRIRTRGPECVYSAGGFIALQAKVEQAAKQDFASAARPFLDRAGMARSTYGAPSDPVLGGHDWTGAGLPGGWHRYPQTASQGLWTTPGDYARGLAHILSDQTLLATKTPGAGGKMCGFKLGVDLVDGRLETDGSTNGYRAFFVAHPDSGNAAVCLTNGDNGFSIAKPVIKQIIRERGWSELA